MCESFSDELGTDAPFADSNIEFGGTLVSTEQSGQASCAVAKAVFMDAELIQHGEVKVGHRGFKVVAKVTAGLKGAAGSAGEEDGEVFVVVAVAVADSGAVEDHAVVQKATVSFGDGFEAL